MKIGFIGLSHLGLCYLAASAARGCNVIGYTKDKNLYNKLKNFDLNINEKNLLKILKKNKKKITFTNNIENLNTLDIIFISLDIKTSLQGKSDLSELKSYLKIIYEKLKKDKILILLSQVPPGFTDKIKWNKKKLFYQVETLVFGEAIERANFPERIIIGKYDKNYKMTQNLKRYYNLFTKKHIEMSYASAELSKIAINFFLASSITTTNTLAEICEKISADWSDIVPALKSDKRIGKYAYLKPGLGISGGNIIRDIKSIKKIAMKTNSSQSIMNSIISNSNRRKLWALDKIKILLKNNNINKISILGLSYKEGTNSIINSPSLFLIKKFKNIEFYAYDPIITKIKNYNNLILCNSIKEAISKSSIVILATPHREFKNINFENFKNIRYLFDPYNFVDIKFLKIKFKYFKIGN